MKVEHLRQLARLAIDSQDHALMLRALELMAQEPEKEPEPVEIKPEPKSNRAIAVRNLIAAWRPYQESSQITGLQTPQIINNVISKLSDEDISFLFPNYKLAKNNAERGWVIEDGIANINIALHTDKIVCTHGNGRRFYLRKQSVKE